MKTPTPARPTLLSLLLALGLVLCTGCREKSAAALGTSGAQGGLVVTNPTDPDRPYFVDFGELADGQTVSHTYVLENTTDLPVTVHRVQSSCGCAVPALITYGPEGEVIKGKLRGDGDVATVQPGGVLELTVKVEAKGIRVKNEHKLTSVILTTDDSAEGYYRYEQHSVVRVAYQATPLVLDFKELSANGGGKANTELFPTGAVQGVRLLGLESATEPLEIALREEERPNGLLTILEATLPAGMEKGVYQGEVVLGVSGVNGEGTSPSFRIPVVAQITADVVARPRALLLRTSGVEAAPIAETRLDALIPGMRYRVVATRIEGEGCEDFLATVEPLAADSQGRSSRWKLVLSAPEGLTDARRGRVVLELDTPELPEIEVPFALTR